ncbi:MAG: ketoacyl-ACP synthase III [Phycisphaerales bacterium]|nr:ketoacyl-ACP synthase III [Phycisphaerales bacterium]MCB9835279.1 ketoacyl-ACP synthase III [Phycisphaera sp.]
MPNHADRQFGIEIVGIGAHTPDKMLTNKDLEGMMDTSDEWIQQRTGIKQRYKADHEHGETVLYLAKGALEKTLANAKMDPSELDLVILATMSQEMTCPPTACRLTAMVGAGNAGAFDFSAACCGFVFAMNTAYGLMQTGPYKNVAVIGADTLTQSVEFNTHGRAAAILFGDAAAGVILKRTEDKTKGLIAQAMHSDGTRWDDLYIPKTKYDLNESDREGNDQLCVLHMNGAGVFRFAVGTFPHVIGQTLEAAGITADDVDHFVCHQSNQRILQAAKERFGLPDEKLHVNIDRFGNTVAASVPLVLNDLREAGRIERGQKVMFVGFGGGLTWGTSLWQI